MIKNSFDKLTDGLVDVIKYSNSDYDYPDLENVKPDDGVIAEWFYSAFDGSTNFSELTAINLYTLQEIKYEEIGELMLGIALVEMKHYAKLGDFIKKLGGETKYSKFNSSSVKIGGNTIEALKIAIESESATIDNYNKLVDKISNIPETSTSKISLKLLTKLINDEVLHKQLLNDQLKNLEK